MDKEQEGSKRPIATDREMVCVALPQEVVNKIEAMIAVQEAEIKAMGLTSGEYWTKYAKFEAA